MAQVVTFVEKRDKSHVPFDPTRIQNAIFSAARAVGGADEVRAKYLTLLVVDELNLRNAETAVPSVEEIQDIVEQKLIDNNHIRTAKAFSAYRENHTEQRELRKKQLLDKIGKKEATITNDEGEMAIFDMTRVIEDLDHYCFDLENVDPSLLVKEAVSNLYEGITLAELNKSLINSARSKIELDPEYSYLAARLLLKNLYRSILPQINLLNFEVLKNTYRANFGKYISEGMTIGMLDPRMSKFDIEKLSNAILPNRDYLFHYRGLQTVVERYLQKSADQQNIELPQYMWMRIAMGLSINEENHDEMAIKFYNVMSEMLYVPSTPTLFNSGTTHPQLSSCFLNTVDDSLLDIFKSYSDNAMLSKYAGGLGTDWTNVRSLGSRIAGTNGISQGVIPFLKIFNDVALAVNQGGKRKGAMCAYLEFWHGDILEFIEAKKNTGDERRRLHDCHTAVWIPDLFMKRLANKEDWTLFSPSDVPELHDLYGKKFEEKYVEYEKANVNSAKTIPAQSLWRKLLTMTYETGHPWLTFKDACNVRNPQQHVGVIHNSNLCTEITLNNSADETAVCNLGSINLAKFINNRVLDARLLQETVETAIRMLDNVIDINFYPTIEAKNSNFKHRPVGLGVMGYQDALFKMNLSFDSEEHLIFADQLLEQISYHAISTSAKLAGERGAYQTFKGSLWDQGILPIDSLANYERERGEKIDVDHGHSMNWEIVRQLIKKHGMRNSNCMAIAPTATISNIAGVYPSIEPVFRNIYVKENTDGSFIVPNNYLTAELRALGLWNEDMVRKMKIADGSIQAIYEIPPTIRRKYKETFEIPAFWLIKAAARRGKWIDQSQSLNIFVPQVSGAEISNIYNYAWKAGVKTTYYLRTFSASQVTKSIGSNNEESQDYVRKPMISPELENSFLKPESLSATIAYSAAAQPGTFSNSNVNQDRKVPGSQTDPLNANQAAGTSNTNAAPKQDQASNQDNLAAESNVLVSKMEEPSKPTSSQKKIDGFCVIDDPDCEACQ